MVMTARMGLGWVAGLAALLVWGCGDDGADGPGPQAGGGVAGQSGAAAAFGMAGRGAGGAGIGGGRAAGAGGSGGSRPAAGSGGMGGSAGASGSGGAAGTQGGAGGTGGQGGSAPPALEDPCPDGPFGDPLPPQQSRTAQLVKNGFDFLEGPVWIASQGVLLFSDMHMGQAGGSWPPSTIERFTPPNTFAPFVESGSNGLAITPSGKLLACTHDMQTLSLYDLTTKARETLPLTFEGKKFNSPNDATVRSDGTIYFTDPNWQLGGRDSETDTTGVYRVTPGGEVDQFETGLQNPNGIALSPDERTLYVGSQNAPVMAYALGEDGTVGARSEFAPVQGTDGLAVDCAGNVYVTAGQVQVFDPDGDSLGTITVPETPANAAFGGADRRTLYITARTGLYSIQLNVPGYPY